MYKHYTADEIAEMFLQGRSECRITVKQANWLMRQWRRENNRHSALGNGRVGASGSFFDQNKVFLGTWEMAVSPINGAGIIHFHAAPEPVEEKPAPSVEAFVALFVDHKAVTEGLLQLAEEGAKMAPIYRSAGKERDAQVMENMAAAAKIVLEQRQSAH